MIDQISENVPNGVHKRRLLNAITAVMIVLAFFLAFEAINALKEYSYIGAGIPAGNTLSVSGEGEVFAVPDIATFSFSVVEDGKTVKEAQDKASTKMNSILAEVKSAGVDEKDIQTVDYSSNPKYEYSNSVCPTSAPAAEVGTMGSSVKPYYCPPGKQVLTGYEVSQTISVKVRKTDDAGGILTKVGGLGASNISGLNFVVDDLTSVQAEARDKAIADAKSKAQALSKSLGVSLSRIVSFNEGGNYPVYYDMKSQSMSAGSAVPAVAPELPVGQNKIVSNVTITYEVR